MNTNSSIPRTDVFGAGLSGALMVVVGMILNGDAFDFHAVAGVLTAVFIFAAGYAPKKHKNTAMAIAGFAAIVAAYAVGSLLGVEGDKSAMSAALVGMVMALVGVIAPPNAQTEAIVGGADGVNAGHNPPEAPRGGPIARDTPPRL